MADSHHEDDEPGSKRRRLRSPTPEPNVVPFTEMTAFGSLTIIQALGILEDTGKLQVTRTLLNQVVEAIFAGVDVSELELYYPADSPGSGNSSDDEDAVGSGAESSREEGGEETGAANDTGRSDGVQGEVDEDTRDEEDVQKDVSGDADGTSDDDQSKLRGKKRSLSDGGKEDEQDLQDEQITSTAPTPINHDERSAHKLPGPQKMLNEQGKSQQTPNKLPYCTICTKTIPKNTPYKNLEQGKGRVCMPCSEELGKGQSKGKHVGATMESPGSGLRQPNIQSPNRTISIPSDRDQPNRTKEASSFQLVPQRRSAGAASSLITSQLALEGKTSLSIFDARKDTSSSREQLNDSHDGHPHDNEDISDDDDDVEDSMVILASGDTTEQQAEQKCNSNVTYVRTNPSTRKKINAAQPIQPRRYDHKSIYSLAYEGTTSTMAYCGFRYIRTMSRYCLSPAFLPVLIKFAIVMESERIWKIRPTFEAMMDIIYPQDNTTPHTRFPVSLEKAWDVYHANRNTRKEEETRSAQVDAATEFFAYCIYWLVEEGPKELERPHEELEERRQQQKKDAEGACGPIPDIDLREPIELLKSQDGMVLQHDNDKCAAERYHRALQLLYKLWRMIQRMKGETFRERWTVFWQSENQFSDAQVDLEEYAPPWMRAGVADQ